MPLGPVDLLISNLDTSKSISILSRSKNKRIWNRICIDKQNSVYYHGISFQIMLSAILVKYILELLAISWGAVTVFPFTKMQLIEALFLGLIFTNSFIPSHNFLRLLLFAEKYLAKCSFLLTLIIWITCFLEFYIPERFDF